MHDHVTIMHMVPNTPQPTVPICPLVHDHRKEHHT